MENKDLLSVVKAETQEQHQQLESVLPLTQQSFSLEEYKELLKLFLGFFDPVEKALAELKLPEDLEFEKRTRTKLLERDLYVFGLNAREIDAIPRFEGLSPFPSLAHALGVMYVLEGSRLGGRHVTRLLHQRLGLSDERGCSFFGSHGQDVRSIWKNFCEVARARIVATEDRDEFVKAAKLTFTSFEKWVVSRDVPIS